MKRGLVILFLSLILLGILTSFVLADDNVDKAYTCLEGKVKDKCSQLTLEEQEFSLLALAYDSGIQGQCKNAMMSNSKNNECWPKSSCTLRETALATLALNYIGADASKPEKWLISQNKTPDELTWYLEIDTKEISTCKISYDNSSSTANTITIAGDKKLSISGSGNCLFLSSPNYWLQISQSCLTKNFKVSCDKDFITALLYKKTGSDVWHVSSQTKSSSASGTTENQVNSLCFKQGNSCNYEGSLWTALALQKNHDISSFLPYLIALASDNKKYNPYSFLYILTGSDEYLANIRSAAKDSSGLWTLSSPYGKYYDTAASLLALQQLNDDQAEAAKTYLLEHEAADGCWQSTRTTADTAFLLYAAWPKSPISIASEISYCEDYSKFCSSRTECSDVNGEVLDNYACKENALKICCSKQVIQKTCAEKNGVKCLSDENCDGDLVSSSDTSSCCQGECKAQETSACEDNGFTCRSGSNCLETEDIKSFDCAGTKICCGAKSGSSYWWLWLLIILIILVVLAIIFKNRLSLWFFQIKNRFKSGKVTQTRPPFSPPPSSQARPMQRFMPSQSMQRVSQPIRKPVSRTDKELDETLKKLREMSK